MRRWVRSVSKQVLRRRRTSEARARSATGQGTPRGGAIRSPRNAFAPPPLGPSRRATRVCDFLTYIFHGLALAHGTTQELCRSTATVWFVKTNVSFSHRMISRDHGA